MPPTPSASTTRSARRCTCAAPTSPTSTSASRIVHELTHALQDQHFDLTKLDDAVETAGEDFALTALVEGDATSVEDDYLFSLPQAEQDAVLRRRPHRHGRTTPSSSDIPPVLDLFTGGPYVFGSRYVGLLRQAGGQGRVNDAFANPPSTEEEIIDPVAAARRTAGQAGRDAEVGRRRATQWQARRVRCAGASTWCWRRVSTPSSRSMRPRDGVATATSASPSAAPTIRSACASRRR